MEQPDNYNNYNNENTHLVVNYNSDVMVTQTLGIKRKTLWDENRADNTFYSVKTTKWGKPYEKTFTPIPFSYFPKNMSLDNIEIILRRSRLDDLNKRLANNNFEGLDNDVRSPSPEPVYDLKTHVRLNTFEIRQKEEYLKEKNNIIEELIKLDKEYKPPSDWKPPKKTMKLYYNNKPDCNITALLLGPKGITHRELEKKTGCKLSIRDKDNKSGVNYDNAHVEDSPYVLLQAKNTEILNKGVSIIKPILNSHSQEHFHFRNLQKQLINKQYGLEASDKDMGCENCGEKGHYTWACPLTLEANMSNLECALCNEKGHLTIDCKSFLNGQADTKQAEFDDFMKKVHTEDNNNIQSAFQNSILMRSNMNMSNFNSFAQPILVNQNKNIPLPLINTFPALNQVSQVNQLNQVNQLTNVNGNIEGNLFKQTQYSSLNNTLNFNDNKNFTTDNPSTNTSIVSQNQHQSNFIENSNEKNKNCETNINLNDDKTKENQNQCELELNENSKILTNNSLNNINFNHLNNGNSVNRPQFPQPILPVNHSNINFNLASNPMMKPLNTMNMMNMNNFGIPNQVYNNNIIGNYNPYLNNMNQGTQMYKNAPVFVPPPDYYLKLKKLNENKEKK
jgi:hypothetical protein